MCPFSGWRPFESTIDQGEPFRGLSDIQAERSVALPMPVQTDRVKASDRDGVLVVRLPKVEAVKPKEIKIDVL